MGKVRLIIKNYLVLFLLIPCFISFSQTGERLCVPISYNLSFIDNSLITSDKPLLKDYYSNMYSKFSAEDKNKFTDFLFSQLLKNKTQNYSGYFMLYEYNLEQDIKDCKSRTEATIPGCGNKVMPQARGEFKSKTDSSSSDGYMELFKNKKMAMRTDSLYDPNKPEKIILDRKLFSIDKHGFSINTLEDWIFDVNSGQFTKDVLFYGINRFRFDLMGQPNNWEDFIFVKNNPSNANWKLYKKNVVYDVCIKKQHIEYAKLNGDNFAQFDLSPNCRNNIDFIYNAKFLNFIFANADEGKAEAYNITKTNKEDSVAIDFSKKLSVDEIQKRLGGLDSTSMEDPKNPGQFFTLYFPYEIKLSQVWGFRFYEDWYINEETFSFKKVVKGMVFIDGAKNDNAGEAIKKDFDFYVKFRAEGP